jgi:phthiodiolone/phenolphthiodiolone dimycocerosates ketoreductase
MVLGAAEDVGADSLWTFDHLLGIFPSHVYSEIPISELLPDPDALFDPFALCAWAGRTTELPLGIAVTDSIRRAAPDVARSALTLQHLCKGGFNLGVGCGEVENLTPFGYSFDRPVAATERFLKTLRHILDTGRMPDGPGRFGFPAASDRGSPKVWVAGHRPRMLRLTGQYGDGWLPFEVLGPEEYRGMKSAIAEHAAAAGRPEPEAGLWVFTVLGESRDRVREMFEAQPMAKLFTIWTAPAAAWQKYGFEHPAGKNCRSYLDLIPHDLDANALRELAPRIPFELVEECLFAGSADEVAERIQGFARVGCEHLILANFTGLVGGMTEAMARGSEWVTLCHSVQAMGNAPVAMH